MKQRTYNRDKNMKKSDLRRIIREEVISMIRGQLNEAFGDPIAAKLAKMGGIRATRWLSFWRSAAKTYDIAWDKLPKGSFRKVSPSSPEVKKGMAFYVINSDKENPYDSSRYGWDRTLRGPAVLAVTVDNKVQYFTDSRTRDGAGIGSKSAATSYRGTGTPVGKGVRGTLMVKKLKELADDVFVFDLDSYRGGTKALKAQRADLKLGKDKFKDHKAWKKANLDRYKQILAARVGTRDQVDAMVAKAVKLTNAAVEEAMEVPKLGRYDQLMTTLNGKEVELRAVTYIQGQILQQYARYIQYENEEDKAEKDGYGGDYYGREKKATALDIKEKVRAVETGNVRY
jgi:hypothetical protein